MLSNRRWLLTLVLLVSPAFLAGCSDDDESDPTVLPPTQVAVTPLGATRARVSFTTSSGGADSYVIERAAGASGGTFAQVATPAQPGSGTQVMYEDAGLEAATAYRYRVAAINGGLRSSWSNEVSVTTLAAGTAARQVTLDINSSQTWYADTVYTLVGFIHVDSGVTLTIQPGTRIRGYFAIDTLGALFIMPGAKINAVGTAANPIVFTSGRAEGQRQAGDWGGLIIVGRAPITRTGVNIDIEGTGTVSAGAGSGKNYPVRYSGRNVDNDDSGELRYVRVEFAGYAPSNGNELNSFTFAAVGSTTKLSYLQSLAGLDDSFEWFGGSVDAHHLVSYESGDDHFDMSEGFRGRLQYLIAYQDTVLTQRSGAGTPSGDPQGIENDGCTGSGCPSGEATTPLTQPVVANFTLVGTGKTATAGSSGGVGMMLRRGTAGYYVNGIVARWPRAGVSVRDSSTYNRVGATATQDLATANLAIKNVLFLDVPTVFQTGGSSVQNTLDLAGNALVNSAAGAASVLTFPTDATAATTAADLDWRPKTGSAGATGGLQTFTGLLAARAGTVVTGTSYLGAVEPGVATPWYVGWTRYAQQ